MSDFTSGSEALSSAWSELQREWDHTRAGWRDGVAERFEQEFWSEWEQLLPSSLAALRELEEVLASISNGDWDE